MPRKERKYHYIYKTTCSLTKRYYYGMHSTNNLKDGYLGSGSELNKSIKKYGKETHLKEIIEYLNDRKELKKREAKIVNEKLLQDPLCMNLARGGNGSNYTLGLVNVKDINGNTFSVAFNDPRYLSGELIGVCKGRKISEEIRKKIKNTITVKDNNGNFLKVNINDPRYLSGELVFMWKDRKHLEETKRQMSLSHQEKHNDKLNSQFGTCWITNEKENKKIKKEDLIPEGWRLGRKIKKL